MLEINRPTLLLDKQKCIRNIDTIIAKAKKSSVSLRPHFKTHQSREVGNWFRERGIESCTVSSLEMAKYFADDNWLDITVAFPINYLEADLINELSGKIKLNLLVSAVGVLPKLLQHLKSKVGVFIDVDTGYHRTGIDPKDYDSVDKLMAEILSSPLLTLEGFLSHAGHTYKCHSKSEVEEEHRSEVKLLNDLKNKYQSQYPNLKLSIGDTPSASLIENFSDVDEVRAGNLVFYDLTQCKIGACDLDQIAVAMVCPVVATYSLRNEIIIYGGGVHFSKDYLEDENGNVNYGKVVMLRNNGWTIPPTAMYVKSLSQEHGIIYAPDGVDTSIKPGDLLCILPVHSCLMADAMRSYVTLDGEVIEKFN